MGNTASVEELGRGRRTSHKLAKPRVGNHETNTLLSPIGLPDPRRRFSATRATSLSYGTSPAPSPMWPPADYTMDQPVQVQEDLLQVKTRSRSRSITRSAVNLFRSRSSQPSHGARRRQDSLGMQTPSQSARPSRANSMIVGASESHFVQSNVTAWNAAGSRASVTYDMNSYEAKRLLNLVEEPSYENNSIASESKFHVAEPARKNSIHSHVGETAPTTVSIGRANSDLSLYAPMRRRSLMSTPGVATRIPDPPIPPKSKARFSLPSTPTRRDSLEYLSIGTLSIPPPSINPESIPRVVTPCEEDYSHTGAFKLGTLRITNGSPAVSPAIDTNPSPKSTLGPLSESKGTNSCSERQNFSHSPTKGEPRQPQKLLTPLMISPQVPCHDKAPPEIPISPRYLSEAQFSPSAIAKSPGPESPGLLITSKHTAIEDDLFEDDYAEYSQLEILDVRVDLSAKSLPPRPRLISEGRNPREMMRSDSGVAATPILEHPPGSLAKSDSGYSSNVSLRSFSVKPSQSEKDQREPVREDVAPQTPAKDTFPVGVKALPRPLLTGSNVGVDHHTMQASPPVAKKASQTIVALGKDVMATSERLGLHSPSNPTMECKSPRAAPKDNWKDLNSPPAGARGPPTSPKGPATFGPGSSGIRKPGKLERLLSSARKPITARVAQGSETISSIPAVPKELKARFAKHSELFSAPAKHFTLRPEPSRATLRTIISVGSVELLDDIPPIPSLPKIVADASTDWESSQDGTPEISFQLTDASWASTASNVPARKPIARKPVPIRKDSVLRPCPNPTVQQDGQDSLPQSITPVGDSFPELQHLKFGFPDVTVRLMQASQSLKAVASIEQMKKARSTPPVSMRTRAHGSYKGPQPVRAESTPPGASQVPNAPSLPRRSSRENINSYPSSQPSMSRRSSRENIHSYPSAQPQYDNLDEYLTTAFAQARGYRRSMSIKPHIGEHRLPDWQVRADHHDMSRENSFSHSRNNSLMSHRMQHADTASFEAHEFLQQSGRPPVLRHRSSYDGYGYEQIQAAGTRESFYRDNGPYPSMPNSNGDAYVSDPWSGRPMVQSTDAQGRYPPYVPRGHARAQSLGSHGVTAPYRVLHSYNSPAYRNAPIWG